MGLFHGSFHLKKTLEIRKEKEQKENCTCDDETVLLVFEQSACLLLLADDYVYDEISERNEPQAGEEQFQVVDLAMRVYVPSDVVFNVRCD